MLNFFDTLEVNKFNYGMTALGGIDRYGYF